MPKLTLTAGDFGKGPAAADASAFHLPNPEMQGALLVVPFTDVAEMTAVGSDNASRVKSALRMGLGGMMSLGPVGLSAGLLAARRAPQTVFSVRFRDDRRFTALADAATFADLHAAQVEAAGTLRAHPADAIIAKYLAQPGALDAPVAASTDEAPAPMIPVASPPPSSAPVPLRPQPLPRPSGRPFGRRGL